MNTISPTQHTIPTSPYEYTGLLTRNALAAKAMRGECIGPAPVGYRNVETPAGPSVAVDPILGPLVQEAFHQAAKVRTSLNKILADLTPKGFVSRRGTPMGPSALLNVLTNPFYVGMVRHHGKLYEGTHPPLASPVLFNQVQERLRQRRRNSAAMQ